MNKKIFVCSLSLFSMTLFCAEEWSVGRPKRKRVSQIACENRQVKKQIQDVGFDENMEVDSESYSSTTSEGTTMSSTMSSLDSISKKQS